MFKADVSAISSWSSCGFQGKQLISHFYSFGKLFLWAGCVPGAVGCSVDGVKLDTTLFSKSCALFPLAW